VIGVEIKEKRNKRQEARGKRQEARGETCLRVGRSKKLEKVTNYELPIFKEIKMFNSKPRRSSGI
jgi:hypothetical protein